MRDQHAAVHALAARGLGLGLGLGLGAITREFRIDRQTAHQRRGGFPGISRPIVLDRYQCHLHRR